MGVWQRCLPEILLIEVQSPKRVPGLQSAAGPDQPRDEAATVLPRDPISQSTLQDGADRAGRRRAGAYVT